ncbi:uncharacterized protein si:dkey-20d21.12 isoform X1 [Lates calcarifer]|uniref:Uncharacterized protein si:dkey-20d21.12 isoform X1 n=1 Tax=Lates calcarifer TaxID=8187 RepID=A0AAJ8DQ63_LATCA|nr:uncharacterized protein si:dkey-20d21.12 isoform X1 [Lates calcarifer]
MVTGANTVESCSFSFLTHLLILNFPSRGGEMSRPPSSQTTPQFYRVSERDLTEIELHSVDSINDLHRTHPEHSHKGMRPPRPAYTPSPNGNPYICDMTAVSQRRHPVSGKWQSRLQDMLTPSSPHAYAMGCAIITLLLLTVLLIFYFLVQQGGAIRMLTEAVREKETAATELSLLIQELQALRHNLTAMRGGT